MPHSVGGLVPHGVLDRTSDRRLIAAYLAGQSASRSRQTALDALRRVSRVIARIRGVALPPDAQFDAIRWCSIEYEQAIAIRAGLAEMSSQGEITPGTANLTLSHLRSLFAVAATMRLITPEQAMLSSPKFLKTIRGKRQMRGRAISAAEERALRSATASLAGYQPELVDTAIVLAIGGGLRREEIADLTMAGVGVGELTVIGKGNKERRPSIDVQMQAAIDLWLAVRAKLTPLHARLFCSPERPDRPLSPWSFWWLVRRTAHLAFGDRKPCANGCRCLDVVTGPHDFRRTFASRLLAQGFDLSEVQKLMDHGSIQTTALYDKREMETLREKRRGARVIA